MKIRKKRTLTEEHKRKIAEAVRGRKIILSSEAIENIRKAAAKRKGIKTGRPSDETIEKIRLATKGKKKKILHDNPTWFKKGHIPESPFKKGLIPWNKGLKTPPEIVEKVASQLRGRKMRPEVYEKRIPILKAAGLKRRTGVGRRSTKSVEWSLKVRERDGNKCTKCQTTEKLHAHHIIPWKKDESKRFDIDNGITLCNRCHKKEEGFMKGHTPWNKGIPISEETRKKLSESLKGRQVWNKGLKKGKENGSYE